MEERCSSETGGEEGGALSPRFPVVLLAAPACVCLLFVAAVDVLATTLASATLALAIAAGSTLASIACFAIIAAKSPEKHIQIAATIGIAVAVLAISGAILHFA